MDARILVSSCSFATFVTLETFDLIWKQAENFKNVSDYFLSIVHKLVRFDFFYPILENPPFIQMFKVFFPRYLHVDSEGKTLETILI